MYGGMTAYEAMDYLGTLSGLSGAVKKERIPVLLEQVNLQDHYKTWVRAMSGGMRRRLGIAQALLNDPKTLKFNGTVEELLGRAKGKVYTAEISKSELEKVKLQYLVTAGYYE